MSSVSSSRSNSLRTTTLMKRGHRNSFLMVADKIRMGKKFEKGLNRDKNQSSASQDTQDDDPNRTPEPYVCTGNFQADFTELCRRNLMVVIPPVVPRPKPPNQTILQPPPDTKPEKGRGKEDKNKQPVPEPEPEPDHTEDGEAPEPPPKTYVTKEKFDYFKPCIQVEMENPDKPDTVTEVYIRGWKVDELMMNVFRQCWTMMEKLHTISLWNTGLTADTLSLLASFLPQCASVTNLILDGNTIKEENFHSLLIDDSIIQNFSLRHCGLTDVGAESIARVLGNIKKPNTKLLSLNLTGNKICDVGAEHIATAIRMNRTLLSLSLGSNCISDRGATQLADALSRFPLTHAEVVERRRLMSEKGSPDRQKSPPPSRRADSKDRPGSVRSNTHADKDKTAKRDKSSTIKKKEVKGGKDAKEEEKHDKTKGGKKEKDDKAGTAKKGGAATLGGGRGSGASMIADAGKTVGKTKATKGGKDKTKAAPQDQELHDAHQMIIPLLEPADCIEGQLWISGNRILINLNLSRNKISEVGLCELLKAMQYQTTLTLDSKSAGTGLMRINLAKNNIPLGNDNFKKLNDLMLPKDPFYKPSMRSPETEA